MRKKVVLAHAFLWAAAIIAAAILDAPTFLSAILLPCLAIVSLQTIGQGACFKRGDLS